MRSLFAAAVWALAAPAIAADWQPPRHAFGQPDLEGAWTNATITPLARPAKFGSRLVMTPEEVREAKIADALGVEIAELFAIAAQSHPSSEPTS